MGNREIHVERLDVRLRGVSPEAARDMAARLSPELLRHLAQGWADGGPASITRIRDIDAGTVAAAPDDGAHALAKRVAGSVGDSISRAARGETTGQAL